MLAAASLAVLLFVSCVSAWEYHQPPRPPTTAEPPTAQWKFKAWVNNALSLNTEPVPCKWTDPVSGASYDFEPLRKSSGYYAGTRSAVSFLERVGSMRFSSI